MMTPLEQYQQSLQHKDFLPDATQQNAVQHTQRLYDDLLNVPQTSSPLHRPSLLKRLQRNPFRRGQTMQPVGRLIRGLYFWGGVGRGKTCLMDNFYECLPFEQKKRVHFHRFMQHIHQTLRNLSDVQDPLSLVADQLADKVRIICLDEFHVSDITDAMLLAGLLKALFERGVTLVTTSNTPPDDLYRGGLQRDRFLPAIALIKRHMEVVNVDGGADYRLRTLKQVKIYHYPLNAQTETVMQQTFQQLAMDAGKKAEMLEINGRQIQTICCADDIVWFDFEVLCSSPRSTPDYIELAKCYNTVLLSHVRQMGKFQDDQALRLINLVDEFYDRNVKLIMSAETAPEQLYSGQRQAFQFQRTLSRLSEMCSCEYLEKPHLL